MAKLSYKPIQLNAENEERMAEWRPKLVKKSDLHLLFELKQLTQIY